MMLKALLRDQTPLIVPDAYDALSARLIQASGFKAVQCSGYSMSLAMGAGCEDDLSFERNLETTRDICNAVSIPVMADGEDGYGPPEIVARTVEAFIDAGVEGINIEDQLLRADHKGTIDVSLMAEKLTAAREIAQRRDRPDLVINGRTDALAVATDREEGLWEAVTRGRRYLEAGADMVFVTDVTTIAEAKRVVDEIPGPVSIAAGLPYNISSLPLKALISMGPARISLPTVALFSAVHGIKENLAILMRDENVARCGLDAP